MGEKTSVLRPRAGYDLAFVPRKDAAKERSALGTQATVCSGTRGSEDSSPGCREPAHTGTRRKCRTCDLRAQPAALVEGAPRQHTHTCARSSLGRRRRRRRGRGGARRGAARRGCSGGPSADLRGRRAAGIRRIEQGGAGPMDRAGGLGGAPGCPRPLPTEAPIFPPGAESNASRRWDGVDSQLCSLRSSGQPPSQGERARGRYF